MEGLAIQQLKDNQEKILLGQDSAPYISLNLSDFEKLKLIEELAVPVATKTEALELECRITIQMCRIGSPRAAAAPTVRREQSTKRFPFRSKF